MSGYATDLPEQRLQYSKEATEEEARIHDKFEVLLARALKEVDKHLWVAREAADDHLA